MKFKLLLMLKKFLIALVDKMYLTAQHVIDFNGEVIQKALVKSCPGHEYKVTLKYGIVCKHCGKGKQ